MGRLTDAVKHLLTINILFFVATLLYQEHMDQWFSLWYVQNESFRWWQIITHMFMHGSFMHILFNMYGLWAFGSPLEQMWGRNKFFFFYFSAGLGAALLHTIFNYYFVYEGFQAVKDWLPEKIYYEILGVNSRMGNQLSGQLFFENALKVLDSNGITSQISNVNASALFDAHAYFNSRAVGASGAVYGILVAFAFMYRNAELMLIFLPVPIKAKYFVPVLILIDLFFGFSSINTGIAHFAHIGGALTGFIMMWYWKKNQFNKNRWD